METKTQWYLPLIKKMEVYGMEMVLLVIVLAAGMLWLGFMGHERAKSSGDEACGNPILHVAIAAIAGFAALMLALGVARSDRSIFWRPLLFSDGCGTTGKPRQDCTAGTKDRPAGGIARRRGGLEGVFRCKVLSRCKASLGAKIFAPFLFLCYTVTV